MGQMEHDFPDRVRAGYRPGRGLRGADAGERFPDRRALPGAAFQRAPLLIVHAYEFGHAHLLVFGFEPSTVCGRDGRRASYLRRATGARCVVARGVPRSLGAGHRLLLADDRIDNRIRVARGARRRGVIVIHEIEYAHIGIHDEERV